jgi:hypothetical protein
MVISWSFEGIASIDPSAHHQRDTNFIDPELAQHRPAGSAGSMT